MKKNKNNYLTLLMFVMSSISAFQSLSADNKKLPIESRIVGGEQAQQGDWPWMSALVFTSIDISSSLRVNNRQVDSQPFSHSPSGNVRGAIVSCGLGDAVCENATSKVCLIERGDINFSVKVNNCEEGGGVGAIIYNNEDGVINGTLGEDFDGNIPAVAISKVAGEQLLNQIGDIAEIEVSSSQSTVQDSTCGATFLGNKWVLTAAHCVDDDLNDFRKVNVGEYDLSNGALNAIDINRVYIHSDFNESTLDNDIALIELDEATNAPAIKLASREVTNQFAQNNSISTTLGWGGTTGYEPGEGPTTGFPDILREVELNLLTNEQCNAQLGNLVSDVMICAGVLGGGKSSCQGDSGGPMVIETNEGWQQVGIVSWGVGCAAQGYPGVYTRVGEFIEWLDSIYKGVAIEQEVDFFIVPISQSVTQTVEVVNNSEESTGLGFSLSNINSPFTLNTDSCSQLLANESCQIEVTFVSNIVGHYTDTIKITPDNTNIKASSSLLTAQTIAVNNEISNELGDANITWYSGGNKPWLINNVEPGIESGDISDLQESIVMAVISGAGVLSFDWAVSSEENADDPLEPFDALYLYIGDEEIEFISGEVDFTSFDPITLGSGEHQITWIYRKDPAVSEFDDKGYLRNVVFTPNTSTDPSAPNTGNSDSESGGSSGGGTFFWLSLLLTFSLKFRYSSKT